MRLLLTILLCIVLVDARSQSTGLIGKKWYVIWDDGLMEYRFTPDSVAIKTTGFSFEPTKKKTTGFRIKNTYTRNDLYCFVRKGDSIGGSPVFSATVVREPGNNRVLELLMNCAADDFTDSAEIASAFYTCDTSKAMVIWVYDGNIIESFRKLKDIKQLAPADHKKIFDLYKAAGAGIDKKYPKNDLWFVRSFLRRQQLTSALVATGYNPLIDSQRLEKLGLSIYD